jgi:hypothetical protein
VELWDWKQSKLLGNVYDILSSADGKTRMDKFRNETS